MTVLQECGEEGSDEEDGGQKNKMGMLCVIPFNIPSQRLRGF